MTLRGRRLRRLGTLAGAALITLIVTVPAAAAAVGARSSVSARSQEAADPLGPYASTLSFTVEAVTPSFATASSTQFTISGTMTNTGTEELRSVIGRLQRGDAMADPAGLQAELANPTQPVASITRFVHLEDSIAAGATVRFSVSADLGGSVNAGLGVSAVGVYPVMLNVNADFDSADNGARVGELHTVLTVLEVPATATGGGDALGTSTLPGSAAPTTAGPDTPVPGTATTGTAAPSATTRAAQPVNIVIPLVDRPHRDPTGAFMDDGLTALIAAGGRLDQALRAAEGSALPPAAITLAIDPGLLAELQAMAAGYWVGPVTFDLTRGGATGAATISTGTATPPASGTGLDTSGSTAAGPLDATVTSGSTSTVVATPTGSAAGAAGTTPTPVLTSPAGGTAVNGSALDAPAATQSAGPGSAGTQPAGTDSAANQSADNESLAPGSSAPETSSAGSSAPGASTAEPYVPQPGPTAVPGIGSADAASFLARLKAAAHVNPVLVLPYSDLDAVAAVRNGRSDWVTEAISRGRSVASDILGADANLLTSVTWPIDGLTTEPTLDLMRSYGMSTAVLAPDGVTLSDPAAFAATASTAAGTMTAIRTTSELPDGALPLAAFTAVTAQNYLSGVSRPAVYAPARDWRPTGTAYAALTTLLAELAGAGVTSGVGLASIGAGAGPATALVSYPDGAQAKELPEATFTGVTDVVAALNATQEALTPLSEPAIADRATTAPAGLFTSVVQALPLQAAGGYRNQPDVAQQSLQAVVDVVESVRSLVSISPPTSSYTLTSSSSPVLVTIRNDLPYTVNVRVRINPADAVRAGVQVQDVGVQTVSAGRTLQVVIPATISRTGPLSVRAQLTTPGGTLWGPEQELQMTSTAYGQFTIWIIVVAAVIVVVTSALRIRRRWLDRKARIAAGLQ